MSTTVDSRVVEMRFDNQHFEKNVQTSMSTLEKLKQKLNLTGASKGLENINTSASKVNLNPVSRAVETVGSKFSALEVMGVTALANLTNSAVNAGKRIVSSLTVDPIKTGFNEYELKMDSVKTIMASTGEDIKVVNKYLEELNEYSDQTIYSFSDMTQNIGKFTNAGVKLEDAVMAIKGISNEAAVSGANANEASRAMYNFAQALSAGHVKLIDWKSIENANMATKEFKEQLIESAVAAGTVTKGVDGMYQTMDGKAFNATKNFNETLQDQWMTTDVLVGTLKKYADNTTVIGKKAFAAAQDVTKFSQMLDVLRETAQSGWAKTWELIFGDLTQAKALFTPLTNFFSSIIDAFSDARNKLLESAFGKSFKALLRPLQGLNEMSTNLKKGMESITAPVQTVTKTLEDYNNVVKEVIRGNWGKTQERWNALTEAGYDWATVQNMVNEALGNSKRHATDFVIGQDKMLETTEKNVDVNNKFIASLAKMSDAELEETAKLLELSDRQVQSIRDIKTEADKLGVSVEYFLDNIENIDGRWVFMNTFKNIGNALVELWKVSKKAWYEIFPPKSVNERAQALYNIMAAVHKLSTGLGGLLTNTGHLTERGDKLARTLKGVFAILDIISTIANTGFKFAFKALTTILGHFNLDILDVTAYIGDMLVAFDNFLNNNKVITGAFEGMAKAIEWAIKAVEKWINALRETPQIQKIITKIRDIFTEISDSISSGELLAKMKKIGTNIIESFQSGFEGGFTDVIRSIVGFIGKFIQSIKDLLGIHSPSTVMIAIGGFLIAGLIAGISGSETSLIDIVSGIVSKIIELFKNMDWGAILTVGIAGAVVALGFKITKAISSITNPLDSVGDFLDNAGNAFKAFGTKVKSEALVNVAKAILILVVALGALCYLINTGNVWEAVGVLGVLTAGLIGLSVVIGLFGPKTAINTASLGIALMAIAGAFLIVAFAIKQLNSAGPDGIKDATNAIGEIALMFAGIIMVSSLVKKGSGKVGMSMILMAGAIFLLSKVVESVGTIDPKVINNGLNTIGQVTLMFGILIAACSLAGKGLKGSGVNLILMIGAMALLIKVAEKVVELNMHEDDLEKALIVIGSMMLIFSVMMLSTNLIGKNAGNAGFGLLAMIGAMYLLLEIGKRASKLKPDDMKQGIIAVGVLVGLVAGMMLVAKLCGGSDMKGLGGTMLALSLSVAILAGVAALLGLVDTKNLAKGIIAVGFLSAFVAVMVFAARGVQDCMGAMIALTVMVGLLMVALALLSQIPAEKIIPAAASIGTVLLTLAAALSSVSKMKSTWKDMASLIVMTVMVGALGVIIHTLAKLPVQQCLGAAGALSMLLLSLSASMFIISKTGTIGPMAMLAIGVMTLVTAALAGILYLIKDLPVDSTLANAQALSTIILALSAACVVLAVAGTLGPAAVVGISSLIILVTTMGILAAAIGALATEYPVLEDFLDKGIVIFEKIGRAIGSFFGGIVAGVTNGFPEIGENLSGFMNNAKDFFDGVSVIDEGKVEAVKNLVSVITSLCKANLVEALTSWITGGSSMADFAAQLVPFGKAMKDFSVEVAGLDVAAVEGAANAGKMLTEMANTIPNTGGLVAFFAGDNSIATFGAQLLIFGGAIVGFSKIVSGNIDETAIQAAANAGKMMTDMANTIPQTGGLVTWFTGDNDLATFGQQLIIFGRAMVGYSKTVVDIDEAAVTASITTAKSLVELANSLPESGGLWSVFSADNDMSTFGSEIKKFGKALVDYSDAVVDIDIGAVNVASSVVNALLNILNRMVGLDASGVESFKKAIDSLSETNVKQLIKAFDVSSTELSKIGVGMIDAIAQGMVAKKASLNTTISNIFGDMISTVKSKVDVFREAGIKLADNLLLGFLDCKSKARVIIYSMMNTVVSDICTYYDSFYSAGSYLVDGFASGISANTWKAEAKATAMANAALDAAQDALEINSPSKAFMRMAYSIPEGFAKGIDKMSYMAVNSSDTMANNTISSVGKAITRISDAINSDIDAQPTIRPVLDLSDIRAGAGNISSMLSAGSSVAALSNVGSVSVMMNRYGQNGQNGDVVKAINKLGKSLGNGGTTYQINGITYDDGSNVSTAVKDLVRAARIERRI